MNILSYIKSITNPYLYWVLLLNFIYLFQVHVGVSMGGFYFNAKGISLIVMSFIPIAALFYFLNFLFSRSTRGLIAANISLVSFYGLLAGYHFDAKSQFIWDMFIDNVSNAFHIESLIYMWASIEKDVLLYVLVFIIILLFMQWRYASISRYQKKQVPIKSTLIALLIYCIYIISPAPCYDPISGFVKSIYLYYFKSSINVQYTPGTYPLLQNTNQKFKSFKANQKQKPDIFLIVVESFNQSIIHKKTEDGKDITPFLNKLENRSLVAKQFYANSVQSARGYSSIFLSLIPSITNKISREYVDLNTYSLADALKDNGYDNQMFHAYKLNGFDNAEPFFKARGFNMTSVTPYLKEEDSPYIWRDWGPEDVVFFKRFFDYYDEQNFIEKPMFFSLITIASHYPFNLIPEHRQFLYKNPKNIHQSYANTMHLVDKGIELFFEELEKRGLLNNSIVIITSDHTIPMGEHGIYHQEVGYYEESFRIPLYIHWPNEIRSQKVETPFSQLDISTTILDMIDAKLPNHHFMGNSIFSNTQSPIYLIQPYGKQFSVVNWPYKFIFHARTGNQVVYNLHTDPMETKNIIDTLPQKLIQEFEDHLNTIYTNQVLYRQNAVYPKAQK